MRRTQVILAPVLFILPGALLFGQTGPGGGGTTFTTTPKGAIVRQAGSGGTTFTTTTVNVVVVTNQTVDTDTFLTRITARLNGGAPSFDQSFPVAFADASVQAAIAQARNALTSAGAPAAVTISGPAQTSNSRTLTNSAVQTVDGSPTRSVVVITNTVGPATILIGDNAATPFVVTSGNINVDGKTTITIPRTVTTTNTYQTAQTYLLAGATASAPVATPVPPSIVLGLTGLAGAGLYELRRRLQRRGA